MSPVKQHLTLDEKREISRKTIMEASAELFYEKGYQNTTTRDIVKKTGILNGSLYNRFKSKEEILLNIITDALQDTLDKCEKLLEEEKNPLIAAVIPSALEISLSSRDIKSASLIYEVHKIWAAVDKYVQMNIEWYSNYLRKFGIEFSNIEDAEMKMITFLGAIGNICGHYANGGTYDCDKMLHYLVAYMGALMGVAVDDVDGTVRRLTDIISNYTMVLPTDGNKK